MVIRNEKRYCPRCGKLTDHTVTETPVRDNKGNIEYFSIEIHCDECGKTRYENRR